MEVNQLIQRETNMLKTKADLDFLDNLPTLAEAEREREAVQLEAEYHDNLAWNDMLSDLNALDDIRLEDYIPTDL